MAVTVKKIAGDGWAALTSSSTSMAVGKPASLAVGDKMSAIIQWASGTISAPAGWAAPKSQSGKVAIFTKTADADDVAASSFTFTTSSSSLGAGTIIALSNVGTLDIASDAGTSTSSGSAPTVTPTAQDYFLIMIAHTTAGNQSGSGSVSAYAFATDNPTWSEILDVSRGDRSYGIAIAGATRSALTATGTATVSFSDAKNMVVMFVLGYKETILVPLDIASIASSALDHVVTGGATFTLDTAIAAMSAPEVNAGQAKWSNQSKNTTSWANQSKN